MPDNIDPLEALRQKADADIAKTKKKRNGHANMSAAELDDPGATDDELSAISRMARADHIKQPGAVIHESGPIQESAFSQWGTLKLARIGEGTPFPTADNAERIIVNHRDYTDRLYNDTFRMRKILILPDGKEREWADADTLNTLIWIQRTLHMPKMQIGAVRHGVDAAANRNQRNSLTLWLDSLEWDKTPRVMTFMCDIFHAEDTAYASDVGRCWLISMMARAFNPGCQVDTMPVLEGGQGTYKSSALAILGGQYYAALPAAFGTRDFLQALDGMWLVEIPDMSSFKGRDIEHVKAIITTRRDRYCRRYAHDAETYPRQCVFAATANRDDWNEDETGARRFLPVRVGGQVELEKLMVVREQLLAEALVMYRAGGKWWDISPEEAKAEQAMRRPDDSWEPAIKEALANVCKRVKPERKHWVAVAEIFDELNFKLKDQGKAEQMRIGRILMGLGYKRQTKWEDGKVRKCWIAPGSLPPQEEGGKGGGNDLFD